jgi:hypothetical protein
MDLIKLLGSADPNDHVIKGTRITSVTRDLLNVRGFSKLNTKQCPLLIPQQRRARRQVKQGDVVWQ